MQVYAHVLVVLLCSPSHIKSNRYKMQLYFTYYQIAGNTAHECKVFWGARTPGSILLVFENVPIFLGLKFSSRDVLYGRRFFFKNTKHSRLDI